MDLVGCLQFDPDLGQPKGRYLVGLDADSRLGGQVGDDDFAIRISDGEPTVRKVESPFVDDHPVGRLKFR
jgi:hypothetical protein